MRLLGFVSSIRSLEYSTERICLGQQFSKDFCVFANRLQLIQNHNSVDAILHLVLLVVVVGVDKCHQLLAIHGFNSCFDYPLRIGVDAFPGVDLNYLVYLKQIDQVIDLDDPPFFLATSLLWNFEQALLCLSHLRSLFSVLLSFKVVLNCISFYKEFVHRVVQIFHFFLCSNFFI